MLDNTKYWYGYGKWSSCTAGSCQWGKRQGFGNEENREPNGVSERLILVSHQVRGMIHPTLSH